MDDVSEIRPAPPHDRRSWRGPTITEVAKIAGLGTATVDRVLNGRGGVREATRQRVLDTVRKLQGNATEPAGDAGPCHVAFLSESGSSFNETLGQAISAYAAARAGVRCTFKSSKTSATDPNVFAEMIMRSGALADGLVVVAREHAAINRAIRAVRAEGVPVVCVTTDLPTSNRVAYVGSDQASAGATAAYLMGRVIGDRQGKILLAISAPYRCQEDREIGFRRVLRSEFSGLTVDERINSNDEMEISYRNVRDYIADHGPPLGVYNVAAGNRGVAKALEDEGLLGQVVFIGHEMTRYSRELLEAGRMDFSIGHDLAEEVALSVQAIQSVLKTGAPGPIGFTPVRVFTQFNCI